MRATCSDPRGVEGQAEPDGMIPVNGRNQDCVCNTNCSNKIKARLSTTKGRLKKVHLWACSSLRHLFSNWRVNFYFEAFIQSFHCQIKFQSYPRQNCVYFVKIRFVKPLFWLDFWLYPVVDEAYEICLGRSVFGLQDHSQSYMIIILN